MNYRLSPFDLYMLPALPSSPSNDRATRKAQKALLARAYADFDARRMDAFWIDLISRHNAMLLHRYMVARGLEE